MGSDPGGASRASARIIRTAMCEDGGTVHDLARRMGRSPCTVSAWRSMIDPASPRLADVLRMPGGLAVLVATDLLRSVESRGR